MVPGGDHHPRTIDSPLDQTGPPLQAPQEGQHRYLPQNPSQPQLNQHEPPPCQVHEGLTSGGAPHEQQNPKRKRESSHNSSEDAEGEIDPEYEVPQAKRQQTSTSVPSNSQPGVTAAGPAFPAQTPSATQHGSAASGSELADATNAGGLALSTPLTDDQLNEHSAEIDSLFGDLAPGQGAGSSPPAGEPGPNDEPSANELIAILEAELRVEETGTGTVQPPQTQSQDRKTYNTQGQTINPQDLIPNPQNLTSQQGGQTYHTPDHTFSSQNPTFQNQQNLGRGGPPAFNPSYPGAPGPLSPQQVPAPQLPPLVGGVGAGSGAGNNNPPAQAKGETGGGPGNTMTGHGGQGNRSRGAVNAQGGRRTHKQRKAIPLGEGAGGWQDHVPVLHPRTLGPYNLAQQQGLLILEEIRTEFENRVIQTLYNQQVIADKMIQETSGRATKKKGAAAKKSDTLTAPARVPRKAYVTTQESGPCKRCLDEGLECNIRQAGGKECDNCTKYRYDSANWPQSMDHDCMFQQGRDKPFVPAERKAPVNEVVNFVHPQLWQCDWCAQEGRYCDADRLMSVKCTACASIDRACTVRDSRDLRERDYLRAFERGFRIMCRLCCKSGKRCSWTDSTAGYGSGKPCKQCEPTHNDKQRGGTCTTFSRLPPFAASGIWNPLPLANVLPAVSKNGILLFIKQRQPWRSQIDMTDNAKVRHQGNGQKWVFPDDEPEVRTNRKSCEFCYYTATVCHFLGSDTESACKTCTYLGIKCMARGGRKIGDVPNLRVPWPPYNLASGTGYEARGGEWVHYYTHCQQCIQAKHHCDRKRPCESCREHNLVCEPASWGKGVFVADRHVGDRSGNYYMALGHGPEGLGTDMVMRDPTRMACGPRKLLGNWPKTPTENAQREAIRAQRCRTREANLQQFEPGYQPPGSGWFPPSLAVNPGHEDPTEPPGWPGSYIRNDREPKESRKAPEFAVHPPGIANYVLDGGPGIGEGGPPPAGGEVQQPPAHHGPGGPAPDFQISQPGAGNVIDLTGANDNQTGTHQEAPADGTGGQVNNPTIGGGDVFMGAESPLPGDNGLGHGGNQPQAQDGEDGAGGQVNDPLFAAQHFQQGVGFVLDDNIYDDDHVYQDHRPQAQDPPFNEQQGQALPAPDEVLGDAVSQGSHAGPGGHGDGTEQEDIPLDMNPFVPPNEPKRVPLNTDTCSVPDNLLEPFKLGSKFVGVERFLSWKEKESPLTEDEATTAPAPGAGSCQPDTAFQWKMAPPFGKPEEAGDERARSVMRIHRPGNNVLRDIPDGLPTECDNEQRPCKDYRAPEGNKCEEADRHGRCENMRHAQKGDKVFPVCADCDLASKKHLWTKDEGGAGLTNREIINMRAYFCADCSKAATNPESWEGRGFNIYGFSADETRGVEASKEVTVNGVVEHQGGWRDEKALPITGCNCARKLMGRVLCSYHRLFLAQKMARQAALMQEWRFQRYKEKVCPMCVKQPGLDSTKAEQVDGPRFWNCLVCNGMVAASKRERRDRQSIEVGKVVKEWYKEQIPQELRDIGDYDYQIGFWATNFSTAETVVVDTSAGENEEDGEEDYEEEDEEEAGH